MQTVIIYLLGESIDVLQGSADNFTDLQRRGFRQQYWIERTNGHARP